MIEISSILLKKALQDVGKIVEGDVKVALRAHKGLLYIEADNKTQAARRTLTYQGKGDFRLVINSKTLQGVITSRGDINLDLENNELVITAKKTRYKARLHVEPYENLFLEPDAAEDSKILGKGLRPLVKEVLPKLAMTRIFKSVDPGVVQVRADKQQTLVSCFDNTRGFIYVGPGAKQTLSLDLLSEFVLKGISQFMEVATEGVVQSQSGSLYLLDPAFSIRTNYVVGDRDPQQNHELFLKKCPRVVEFQLDIAQLKSALDNMAVVHVGQVEDSVLKLILNGDSAKWVSETKQGHLQESLALKAPVKRKYTVLCSLYILRDMLNRVSGEATFSLHRAATAPDAGKAPINHLMITSPLVDGQLYAIGVLMGDPGATPAKE